MAGIFGGLFLLGLLLFAFADQLADAFFAFLGIQLGEGLQAVLAGDDGELLHQVAEHFGAGGHLGESRVVLGQQGACAVVVLLGRGVFFIVEEEVGQLQEALALLAGVHGAGARAQL